MLQALKGLGQRGPCDVVLKRCLPASRSYTADLFRPPPRIRCRKKHHGSILGDTTQLWGPIGDGSQTRPSSTVPGRRPGRKDTATLPHHTFICVARGKRGVTQEKLNVVSWSSKEDRNVIRSFRFGGTPLLYIFPRRFHGSRP
jgi:hypothetical protein